MRRATTLAGWLLGLAVLTAGQLPAFGAEPQCALDYDAQARALVLRYAGADVAIDTQDTGEAIRIAVEFTTPVALRAGAGLPLAKSFASWRHEGDRLIITYDKPYNVVVEDNPHTHVARLVNLAAPSAAQLSAMATRAPAQAPVVPVAAEAGTSVSVAGRLPLVPVPAVEPQPVAVTPIVLATPVPTVRVAPTFVPPSPVIAPVPALPKAEPEPHPVAVALPSLQPAAALPGAAPAMPSFGIGTRRGQGLSVAPSFAFSNYDESYPAGDVAVNTAGVMMPGVRLEGRGRLPLGPAWLQPDWFGTARVDFANYAFRDTLFPLSTHSRQTWRGELAGGHRFSWGDMHLDAGAGYMLRWESTLHSAVSPEPSYAFASGRLLHGPELTLAGAWAPSAPSFLADWGLSADAAFAPYVFNRVDGGAAPLPALMSLSLNVGVERWIGDHRVRLGYQRWSLTGTQYDEVFQGPFISVH